AGALSAELDVDWRAGGDSPQLKIAATRLALADFTLGDAAAPEAAAESIEASDVRVDTGARTAAIGRLALRAPRLRVERDRVAVPSGPTGKAAGSGIIGSLEARGELAGFNGGVPPSGRATLLAKDLPLHLVDPYLDDVLDIDVQKAQASFKGDVRWARAAAG